MNSLPTVTLQRDLFHKSARRIDFTPLPIIGSIVVIGHSVNCQGRRLCDFRLFDGFKGEGCLITVCTIETIRY